MTNLNKLKQDFKKNEELMLSLKKKEDDKKNELLLEILNLMLNSKFILASFDGHEKEYWYCYSIIPNNVSEINALKISKNNKIECGKLSIEPLIYTEDIEVIDPSVFFEKLDDIGCDLDFNDSYIIKECLSYKTKFENHYSKKKAVGYCRLSREGGKNGYDRQIYTIKNNFTEYNVCEFFKETISGTTNVKERNAIKDLITYCNRNNIETLVISELARLGRKTNVILDGIGFLRKNGIKEIYVLFEDICINEDYIIDNNSELKSLAEFCEKDRNYISERFINGGKVFRDNCRKNGIKMGRPSSYRKSEEEYKKQYENEIRLIKDGISYRKIQQITGTSLGTIQKLNKMFIKESENNVKENV